MLSYSTGSPGSQMRYTQFGQVLPMTPPPTSGKGVPRNPTMANMMLPSNTDKVKMTPEMKVEASCILAPSCCLLPYKNRESYFSQVNEGFLKEELEPWGAGVKKSIYDNMISHMWIAKSTDWGHTEAKDVCCCCFLHPWGLSRCAKKLEMFFKMEGLNSPNPPPVWWNLGAS